MPYFLFALLGLAAGGLINILADDLPRRVRPRRPACVQCGRSFGPAQWLGVGRFLSGGCSSCDVNAGWRPLLVELGTAFLFAILPALITEPRTLVITAVYIAILILIIVIDIEHRLILHVVTFPGTMLALVASLVVPATENTILSALVGAALGFILFFIAYWAGQTLFGPGALGFGDVTLSMLLGAMLGFDRIIFTLILGILLGGVSSLVLILGRRYSLRSHIAYGPYLAIAGITMLIWGKQLVAWYLAP